MEQHRIVPFYQTYHMQPYPMPYMPPYAINMNGYLPLYMAQETDMREDLQYLQEMFPETARRYAAKIASVVDRLDYKGSMIYDEYPDRIRLQRLAHDITMMIEKEEAEAAQSGMEMQIPAPGAQAGAGVQPGGTGMRPGSAGTQQGNAGMQPGSAGTQQGNAGMQPGSMGTQQGNAGMRPGSMGTGSVPESGYKEELIYVLLSYEIAKRRHGAGMDLSKFYGTGDL